MEKVYALVTGGNSGIGLDLAHEFAKDGINLIIVGRNQEKLQSVQEELTKEYRVDVIAIAEDLSKKDAPEVLFNKVSEMNLDIKYLVNNAGVGLNGDFADNDINDVEEILDVHIVNLVKLCKALIPVLESNNGSILNVSSIAAFQPLPSYAIYGASKTFIYNFSLALRSELRKKGVSVTVLCPPVTKTQFYNRSTVKDSTGAIRSWEFDSKFVSRRGYKGLMSGKATVFPGISTWIYCTIIAKLIPWRLI